MPGRGGAAGTEGAASSGDLTPLTFRHPNTYTAPSLARLTGVAWSCVPRLGPVSSAENLDLPCVPTLTDGQVTAHRQSVANVALSRRIAAGQGRLTGAGQAGDSGTQLHPATPAQPRPPANTGTGRAPRSTLPRPVSDTRNPPANTDISNTDAARPTRCVAPCRPTRCVAPWLLAITAGNKILFKRSCTMSYTTSDFPARHSTVD